VRDDLIRAGADQDFADLSQGADDGVGQHHWHAPDITALVELRAHGEEAVAEAVAKEEVGGPLSL
jgi:hypothetical protein